MRLWTASEDEAILAADARGDGLKRLAAIVPHGMAGIRYRLALLRGDRLLAPLRGLEPGRFYRIRRKGEPDREAGLRFLWVEGGAKRKWVFALPASGALVTFTAAQFLDFDPPDEIPEREARRIGGREVATALHCLGYGRIT